MEIKTNYIAHNFRNKYLKNAGGFASSSSSVSTAGNGLPYVLDENGNYVVEKQVLFKKSIISKEEVIAYGEDNTDYVGTYAPLNHPHTVDDVTGLKEILDNIEGGSGGTCSIEVIDSLDSVSATAALSARQGRILSELIADKTVTWDTLQNKPSSFTPSAHSHAISGVTGLQTQLDSKASSSHTHTIANISNLQAQLDSKAASSHSHAISAVTGLQTQLDSKAASSHTHTIANVTNLQAELNKKSDTAHTHDSRYYTETEVNNLLATKASSSHTHSIANVTNLEIELNNKSNINHTHAISAVTGLQTQLDSKVNTSSLSSVTVKNSDTVDNLHAASFMRSDTNTSCSGNVSIGGDLVVTGEVTAYSDRRLKTDIQALDNRGLLNPVVYTKDKKRQIGFIAQEVQEVYPELVNEDSNGYLSLNYQQLTAVLSAQINDLYLLIDELKLEISKLKK